MGEGTGGSRHPCASRPQATRRDSVDVHNVLLVEVQQDAEQEEAHVPKHPNGHAVRLEHEDG